MAGIRKKLGPDPRAVSNVEAEKGETVLTNLSRGLNNILEFYQIEGKKHGQKGTPLKLPTNDNGSGASFIFSDRITVENPAVLKFFNMFGKKATIAEISKKQLSVINSSKKILLDPNSDKISRDTAEHNIKTAVDELQLLQMLQESSKGFPNGLPSGTEDLFKKMGVSPEEFFAPTGSEIAPVMQAAEKKAMGGIVKALPKFYGGGDVLGEFGDKDPNAKTQFLYIRDVLGKQPGFKEALFKEYQAIAKDPDYYGKGYRGLMNTEGFNKVVLKTPEEVYDAYLKMQERNLIFKSHGYDVASTPDSPYKNQEVPALAQKHKVPIGGMDDIAKEQIAYWAFEKLASNQGNYSEELRNVMKPFAATQFGSSDDRFKGQSSTISLADGAYTNTSAGQVSKFTPPKNAEVKDDKIVWQATPSNPDPKAPVVVPPVDPNKKELIQPDDFRSQDLRSVNRALSSMLSTPNYQSFKAAPDIPNLDAAYYSPERTIAANNEAVNSAEDLQRAYADAQGAISGSLALAGNEMAANADAISQYADKNVANFQNTASANLELAIKRNAMAADTSSQVYAENVEMQERFRQGVQMAKDQIVNLKNQAETNRAAIYNLNINSEEFKKDPVTGKIFRTGNSEFDTTVKDSSKDAAAEFNSFREQIPGVSDDVAARLFIGVKSGKYTFEDDGILTPRELNRNNTGL